MGNNVSKRVKILIAVVLGLFLLATVSDIYPEGIESFKRGFNAGRSEANNMMWDAPDSVRMRHFYAAVAPHDHDATTLLSAGGVEFTTITASGELAVPVAPGKGAWIRAVSAVLSLVTAVALIAFIINLVKFAFWFPRRPILARDNIVSMHWIAGSLGVMNLAGFLGQLAENIWLRNHVTIDGFRVLPVSIPQGLIIAAILFAMTEIMNLAGRLQNEQDLTI